MKKDIGVKLKETEGKKVPAYLVGLLAIILVVTFSVTLKNLEPANNVTITGGIMVYPLTFLIVALMSKYYGFKETRKAIFVSSALYATFFLLVMIALIPKANTYTTQYNAVVQFLFANEFKDIGSFTLFYPTIGHFFSVIVAFLVSHLIYATVYNAINKYTIDYLAMGLSLFIAYITDRLLFVPILLAKGLIKGSNDFNYLIQCLTSEFIFSVLVSIVLVIIYIIFTSLKSVAKD